MTRLDESRSAQDARAARCEAYGQETGRKMSIRRILIVDDSPTERHVLNDMLTKSGYEVVASDNGEDAIQKAKSLKPDLILMDVVMPGLNGFQATRAISRDPRHARDPDHPVHVEEPGDRQDLGHAPGCARLHREARQSRRAAGEDRGDRLTIDLRRTHAMARAAKLDLRTFQQELASRLATKTAAQVESSRLGLACGGDRWLMRLADAGEVVAMPDVVPGAADAALVPRRREHPRQPVQRRRLRRASSAARPSRRRGGQARLVLFGPRAGDMNAGLVVTRVLGLAQRRRAGARGAAAGRAGVVRAALDGR